MTKEKSILLLLVLLLVIFVGLWLASSYFLIKVINKITVKKAYKIAGIFTVSLFIICVTYFYNWLINYGC